MGIKISFIVPVYNVGLYLSRCVDSLLAQDIPSGEFEVILVDDGSTDDSGTIADTYLEKSADVVVLHQRNSGLGAARNVGVNHARGEYVIFVDSDDFLEAHSLEPLVSKMVVDNLDVLRFNYQNVDSLEKVIHLNKNDRPFMDFRDVVCDGKTFLTTRLGFACYACQFIIRRDLILRNDLQFKSGVYFEDAEWTPRMLQCAGRVTSVGTVVYNYFVREGSITKPSDSEKLWKLVTDGIALIKALKEQISYVNDTRWYDGMISSTVVSLLTMCSRSFYGRCDMVIEELRKMMVFPISRYHLTSQAARKATIINISPALFCFIIHLK